MTGNYRSLAVICSPTDLWQQRELPSELESDL